jgi:hypothetical protein
MRIPLGGSPTMKYTHLPLLTLLAIVGCRQAAQRVSDKDHPALELVREYAARDARGEFTGASAWYDSATQFQEDVPGWDQGAVVRAYTVAPMLLQDDSALVDVTYNEVAIIQGDAAGGTLLSFRDTTYTEHFTVRRTPAGWRITAPIAFSHTSAAVAVNYPSLKPEQRAHLRAAANLGSP